MYDLVILWTSSVSVVISLFSLLIFFLNFDYSFCVTEQQLYRGGVRFLVPLAEEYVFHGQPGGPGHFDQGVDGHLGGAHLDLPVVSRADVRQLRELLPGEPQMIPPPPKPLPHIRPLLFGHKFPTPSLWFSSV